jgi:hypothetical protein
MSISRTSLRLSGLALLAALVQPGVTLAQDAEVKQCATQWVAAKENPKFYQPWGDYFNDCKKKLAEAPAAPKAEEAKPASMPEMKKAEPTAPAPVVAAPAPAPAPAAAPSAAPAPAAAAAPTPTGEAAKPAKPAHKSKKPAQHKS